MTDDPMYIDEDAEGWINLMYCREAAKGNPELRKELLERLSPEVVKAMDECTSYEDFKRRLVLHNAEDTP